MKAEDVIAALRDVGMGELAVAVQGSLVSQRTQSAGKRKRASVAGTGDDQHNAGLPKSLVSATHAHESDITNAGMREVAGEMASIERSGPA